MLAVMTRHRRAAAALTLAAAACPTLLPAVAHRGGTERYTENSRNAFRDAANAGVLRWETDVRWTADAVPVLMHDDTIDRTTTGTGPVAALTLAELRAHRLDSGEPVPTLAELMNDAEVDGATVYVEPKVDPTPAEWASLWAAVDAAAMRTSIVLISFTPAVVAESKALDPSVPTGLIEPTGYRPVTDLTPLGITWYVKHHWAVTAARLDEWSGPLQVAAWTVDLPEDWARMNTYTGEPGRLDGVITNKPHAYIGWGKTRVC